MDDRTQDGDVIFFDLIHVTLVRHTQAEHRPVEVQRHDRTEPPVELLRRGLLAESGQASLPQVAVVLGVREHLRVIV